MMILHRPLFLLIPLFFSTLFPRPIYANHHDFSSIKFDLIHRHALPGAPTTQPERLRELLAGDIARQGAMAQRQRRMWENGGGKLKVFSGADFGNAQYFVSFRVGSPFQRFKLVVDTGSELTWMNCRYRCGRKCRDRDERIGGRRTFIAGRSGSFRPVACSSEMCKVELVDLFGLETCPLPATPCAYDFKYLDGSSASGLFANETVTVFLKNGKKGKLRNVLIGCTRSSQGPNFNYADGVLGLAYHKHSFISKATNRFGGKFSYCLVDHLAHRNVSNYLVFSGTGSSSLHEEVRYTKLGVGLIPPFYTVKVMGISIGGETLLEIPERVWDVNQKGGMIVDSGTSLMFLATPAYRPVMMALESAVARYQRVRLLQVPMKYCFDSTEFDEALVPKLAIHLGDGARFEPHLKSYIVDAAKGVKCLGFVEAAWPGFSTIGNIMQQNHVWEFDLVAGKLGFAPSTCTDH